MRGTACSLLCSIYPFRIFLDVLLELMVTQVVLVEWRDDKALKQKRAFNFLFEKFKTFYMPVS